MKKLPIIILIIFLAILKTYASDSTDVKFFEGTWRELLQKAHLQFHKVWTSLQFAESMYGSDIFLADMKEGRLVPRIVP